jgi:hypothetical protein
MAVMGKLEEIQRVIFLLGWWLARIKLNNCIDWFDINRVAEDLAAMLLNEIYGYKLINLNRREPNHTGIDLGDKEEGIAFQVTASVDAAKIKKNLKAFFSEHKESYRRGIRFFILSLEESKIKALKRRKSFKYIDPDFIAREHIISARDIIRKIERLYGERRQSFNKIRQILEEKITWEAIKIEGQYV